MLNYIWAGLIVAAVLIGSITGKLPEVTQHAFEGAKVAVMTIALPLVGLMALWLGMMRLAEKAGLIELLAKWLRPVMKWLFPEVPENHPAMGSMLMNIAANMLGLANAATPLGLRAMNDLAKLNPHPGTATNAMCTFLAINTSSVQLVPATAIAILAAAGSMNPTAIVGTSLLATSISTAVGIAAVKLFQNLPTFRVREPDIAAAPVTEPPQPPPSLPKHDHPTEATDAPASSWVGKLILILFVGGLCVAGIRLAQAQTEEHTLIRVLNVISVLAIPFMLGFFPLFALMRGVKVYEEFVEGAKEGFQIAIRIIPYLVAMLAAIGMFRGAGGIELLSRGLAPVLNPIGFPIDLLPMVLMRPLSGSATTGLFSDLVTELGPDHLVTRMAGTIFGSTETTLYVVAVYFGAVSVHRTRHAIPAGLLADLAGVIAAIAICYLAFG